MRLKGDPGRIGVATGKTREYGRVCRRQVQFPEACQYVPEDQLEAVGDSGDDPIDLLQRRRLGDAFDLRRTITHAVTPQRQMSSSMPAALRLWQQDGTVDTQESGEDPYETERPVSAAQGAMYEPLRRELAKHARELGDLQALWSNDTKYQYFRDQLQSLFGQDDGGKVIVFPYFRATLDYLRERLGDDRIRTFVLHGGTPNKDEVLRKFRSSPEVDVLLSSESRKRRHRPSIRKARHLLSAHPQDRLDGRPTHHVDHLVNGPLALLKQLDQRDQQLSVLRQPVR